MQTKEVTVYDITELTPKAAKRAREWFRTEVFTDWDDLTWAAREQVLEAYQLLGFDLPAGGIWWTSNYSHVPGLYIEGCYTYAPGAVNKVRAEFKRETELHKAAEQLQAIQRRYFYQIGARLTVDGYRSDNQQADVYGAPPITADDLTGTDAEREFTAALETLNKWAFDVLEEEAVYQLSNENIHEYANANEYTFTESGDYFPW